MADAPDSVEDHGTELRLTPNGHPVLLSQSDFPHPPKSLERAAPLLRGTAAKRPTGEM